LEDKNDIRKKILKRRDSLAEEDIQEKSRRIKEILFSLPRFISAKNILFYASFRSEVRTDIMITEALNRKNVFLPKVFERELKIFEIKDIGELKKGFCGILEPITERLLVELANIELAIIPGVCFDKMGFRIGYGGGYYDRLIPKLSCKKIGLAFSLQIIDEIPHSPLDAKVDKIITEDGII